jgi:hypothetical protein
MTLDTAYEKFFRDVVKAGGGIWVGIQEYEGETYDLVLFNSPKTGSTLALKTNSGVTAHSVRERIHEHNQMWKRHEATK